MNSHRLGNGARLLLQCFAGMSRALSVGSSWVIAVPIAGIYHMSRTGVRNPPTNREWDASLFAAEVRKPPTMANAGPEG